MHARMQLCGIPHFLALSTVLLSPKVRLMKKSVWRNGLMGSVIMALMVASNVFGADEPTALQLVEEGNVSAEDGQVVKNDLEIGRVD